MTTASTQPNLYRRGQTLVIAIIMLGVLLLLGFVFLGVISHNINNAARFQKRSVSQELAEGGIRYVHNQMLYGTLGADWRGLPTPPTPTAANPNNTSDPDAYYTRMGTGITYIASNGTQVFDLGGPDGLGFYTRINFANGRALVRVRYAPSDANVFANRPTGGLLTPGRARNYVIIESVGRQGVINPNDPTTLNATPTQFTNYANAAALQTALGAFSDTEKLYPTSQKQIGFVSIGIIEDALFVTNADRVSRGMDIGMPRENGAVSVAQNGGGVYVSNPVEVPQIFGALQPMFNLVSPPTPAGNIPLGGSIFVNADLTVNGTVDLFLNYTQGDSVNVNGVVTPADATSTVNLQRAEFETSRPGFPAAAWYGGYPAIQPSGFVTNLGPANLTSRGAFSTLGGVIRDGIAAVDPVGFTRSVSYKEPPSMELRDPQTGALRYVTLTRESGSYLGNAGLGTGGNSGRYGHGSGVYVDNLDDFQIPRDDLTRSVIGSEESLIFDWLNPNNGQPNSGWQGPFYTPLGAFVQLEPDGFLIARDAPKANSDTAYWKAPNGTQTRNLSELRFRVGNGTEVPPQVHIVNTLTPGIPNINATLQPADFMNGPVFNGVLYFEGNVRVRGTIPTDVQISLVSGATIYIEGSIVRGVVGSDVATDKAPGTLLSRPSRSSLMLMARDYVTLNTTQFFGPGVNSINDAPNNLNSPDGVFPVRIQSQNQHDNITLEKEFLLNPDAGGLVDPYNPSTWPPFDGNYAPVGGGASLETWLLLSHTADTGSAGESFMSLDINASLTTPAYLFPLQNSYNAGAYTMITNGFEAIAPGGLGYTEPGYTTPGSSSIYGLGLESWQRFAQFETIDYPLIGSANFTYSAASMSITGQNSNLTGTYTIQEEATNDFTFHMNAAGPQVSGPYLMARAAIVPADIRIEASIFAEEGCFFVIPGQWFNPNPNDSRIAYLSKYQEYINSGATAATAQSAADAWRLNSYGALPHAPFYGEPIDAKITIIGAVSENVTPPVSQQAEYLKKWGWIPIQQGSPSLNLQIPASHQVNAANGFAPNLSIIYDPILGTGRVQGFAPNNSNADPYLRYDAYNRPLAPMPRLPVSPALAFFGEQS